MTDRTRIDGPDKVTGAARYAADDRQEGLRYAVLVTSTIPAGRIVSIDASAATDAIRVITHETVRWASAEIPMFTQGILPLSDDVVRYEGEPVAVVVAETLERALEAAALVRVTYEQTPANVDVDRAIADAYEPPPSFRPTSTSIGDVEAGLAGADVTVSHTYTTSPRHHAALEPWASTARWEDGELTVRDATQAVFGTRDALAIALGLEPERVRVISEYIGGGFGCKGFIWPHQLLSALAAREVGGAVRLALTRAQSFAAHGYQTPTRQEVTLGATSDGHLTAIRHHSLNATSVYGDYTELTAGGSRMLYASPAIETTHRVVPINTILPTPMRAPHEGPGLFALESAMDELAYAVGVDPLELRLRNYAEVDPSSKLPFSSKELRACYEEGARRFGWSSRPMEPGSLREGDELVGWGMATALMGTFRAPASARITLSPDGSVLAETGTQEMGGGTRNVIAQITAETLGCPFDVIEVRLGDTRLPQSSLSGGSSTAMSVGSAVAAAAGDLRAKLEALAAPATVTGLEGTALLTSDGPVDLATLLTSGPLAVEASWAPTRSDEFSYHTFGAVFAEVRMDSLLPIPHVSRLVGVYSAGRIINPLAAHSQLIGGVTWGIGQALLERSQLDPTQGRFVSKNLAGYLLPANADVGSIDVSFVEEFDSVASPVGARGIGELPATGVSAAIANAVYHATGTRVRDLPITPEALLTS